MGVAGRPPVMMELTQVQNLGEGPRQPPRSEVSHVQRAESDRGLLGTVPALSNSRRAPGLAHPYFLPPRAGSLKSK